VLEIGSGTGQHAVAFAAAMPHLTWQCSDVPENLPGIRMWLDEAALPNTPPPIALDVGGAWPRQRWDAVFTANTLHIMGWPAVERMFASLPSVLDDDATLVATARSTSAADSPAESNAAFDASLRAVDPRRGLRDREAVDALARGAGFAASSTCPCRRQPLPGLATHGRLSRRGHGDDARPGRASCSAPSVE
jgi:hypothetical protein